MAISMSALLVRQFRHRARAWPIVQGDLNTFFDTALPGIADHGGRNRQGLHDFRGLAASRRFEQNSRPCLLARSALPLRSKASSISTSSSDNVTRYLIVGMSFSGGLVGYNPLGIYHASYPFDSW